jgi:hypothetical protein
VSAAYVSYFPDLAFPGRCRKDRGADQGCAQCGVRKLVLLSGRGEAHALACEEIVRNSRPRFHLVRAAWFAQNFSEGYLLGACA